MKRVSDGYRYEGIGFYVLASSLGETTPLFRCYTGGSHFVSLDSNCEGFRNEGRYGFVYSSGGSGRNSLYRFANPSGDHLITSTYAEGVNAGYRYEGPLGFVPQ